MGNLHSSNEARRLAEALGPTESCLTLEQLAGLLEGNLEEASRRALQAHLDCCPRCVTELALLREFRQAETRAEDAAAVQWIAERLARRSGEIFGSLKQVPAAPARPRSRSWSWESLFTPRWIGAGALATAGLLLVVAAGLYLNRPDEPALEATVREMGPEVMRATAVEFVGLQEELASAPTEFRWHPVEGAVRYDVRLMEVDRTELWSAPSAGSSVEVPPRVRSRMAPRKTLLVQVVALDASGRKVAESPITRFRVMPSAR